MQLNVHIVGICKVLPTNCKVNDKQPILKTLVSA